MIFKELLEYCKLKAIADSLSPTEDSVWREACRTYSESFNTPLKEVLNMDPEHVFLNNFERQLKGVDLEENIDSVLEDIYTIENPDYDRQKEEDIQKFIRDVETKEEARLKGSSKKRTSE